eukprot:Tbor_TRINITY_DN4799_c0_g1::TRINITY_DN4799_c0_g1_i1::g.16949::m.16949/K03178/UBE1, UBA1; ubiquitin-activating enzyme E1
MADNKLDAEQLYNRQMYVIGAETQKKYGECKVLMVGLSGAGCEVAKNLILTGVKAVTLLDSRPIQWTDLSVMFYATENDVGKQRAATLAPKLGELNRFVTVSVADEHNGIEFNSANPIPNSLYQSHQIVIFCNFPSTSIFLQTQNEIARKNNCKFVTCETRGVIGSVFIDGGSSFTVVDQNGEDCQSCIVTAISPDGSVLMHDDKKHECETGDMVYFHSIDYPPQINTPVDSRAPLLFEVVDVIGPTSLKVKFPTEIAALESRKFNPAGGYLVSTKMSKEMKFKSLTESLKDPAHTFVNDVETKITSSADVHSIFRGIHQLMEKTGCALDLPPTPVDESSLIAALEDLGICDESVVELASKLAPTLAGNINPMATAFGGLAAQEVLKLCSGKFSPINQWLTLDFRELLLQIPPNADRTILNSRYDGAILVFGRQWQAALQEKSIFIVGAGALGCEYVKNFALMGIGTSGKGKVVITDMDNIEMSNLSRQFLFRSQHIGHSKSKVAAEAAKAINPSLNIISKEDKVASETEHIFNLAFWESLDVVCNALDNVSSRRYVDSQCVDHKISLFESGTLGAKCNVQVVIPYLTNSYSNSYDPPEKSIPLCTLKNFPNAIEHTIQWARDAFHQYFVAGPADVVNYLANPVEFNANLDREPSTKASVIAQINNALSLYPSSPEQCILLARSMFDDMFDNAIRQLLYNIPLDKVDEHNVPFWGGAKKAPTPQEFDVSTKLHVEFVFHAASLIAKVNKKETFLQQLEAMPLDEVGRIAQSVQKKPFVPHVAFYETNENKDSKAQEDGYRKQQQANSDAQELPPVSRVSGCTMAAEEFEKDNDANHHIDFITATSNMRAACYNIPQTDRNNTKRIAGSIIPAMVTTTAFVTGLASIEVLKYISGEKTLDNYRNIFANMAINLITLSEPEKTPVTVYKNEEDGTTLSFNMWDRVDINEKRDLTLQELVDLLEKRYNIELFMVSLPDGKMLYNAYAKKKEKMIRKVSEIISDFGAIDNAIDHLTLLGTGTFGDEDIDLPSIRYRFRKFGL